MNLSCWGIGHHPLLELPLIVLDSHFNQISCFCFVCLFLGGWLERRVWCTILVWLWLLTVYVTGFFSPMESPGCGPAPWEGGVAGYCHSECLSIIQNCLVVCKSLHHPVLLLGKGIFVHMAEVPTRTWENNNPSKSFSSTTLFFRWRDWASESWTNLEQVHEAPTCSRTLHFEVLFLSCLQRLVELRVGGG